MAISASLLVLGLAESVIGIWAAIVSCCLMKPCVCCNCCCTVPDQQAQQVVYTVDAAGNVMAQGLDGVPVAVPVQARDGMVDMQPFGAQGGQPQMVLVPVPGAADGQVLMGQCASSAAMPAAEFLRQEQKNPPLHA